MKYFYLAFQGKDFDTDAAKPILAAIKRRMPSSTLDVQTIQKWYSLHRLPILKYYNYQFRTTEEIVEEYDRLHGMPTDPKGWAELKRLTGEWQIKVLRSIFHKIHERKKALEAAEDSDED